MKKNILIILAVLLPVVSVFAQESADDIIRKLDNTRVFDGMYATGSIIIDDKHGTRVSDYISQSSGTDTSLVEITSAAEKGQKTLRVKDKIYLYYPDAEQVVTLSKSMMQQSMLDSDISYDDMAGDFSLLDKFTAKIEKEEKKGGNDTYVIYLSAKNDRKETYPYQRLWIRKDTYTLQFAEYYTRRKKLRKTLDVKAIQEISKGRYTISEMVFKDILKKGNGTTIKIDNIDIRPVDKKVFSVENLRF